VGLRPTTGLVSRDGIAPKNLLFDTAGPMARTVTDVARLLTVIAGVDPNDPTSVDVHTHYWQHRGYDDLEREVRANLVYRMFTRIDAGEVPDAKTILKIARALGPEVIEQWHRQVIEVAKRAGVTHGRRFRIDTTVVETNVHYPTDSTLLQDGVRCSPGRCSGRVRRWGISPVAFAIGCAASCAAC
jgi:Asp-tRNA(Asn)/Glu-tRNA(Gln) amidotransferase A subunit family amidase